MKRLSIHIAASGMMAAILLCSYAQAKEVASLIGSNAAQNIIWPDPAANKIERMTELAATDQIALIQWCMDNYKNTVRNYQGLLHKQERINGKLRKRQSINVWFRETPFSVVMKWKKNPKSIDKLLYVEGQNKNKMIVHPTGAFAWIKSVKKHPRCKEALKASLRTCDQFGFYRNMQSIREMLLAAKKTDSLKMRYLATDIIDGRSYIKTETTLNIKDYPCTKLIMDIDTKHMVPTKLAFYDRNEKLICQYEFTDLKLNQGIDSKTFDAKTHRM
ncbi:MAG: DUF1571 domain-containing protein [Planctomycetes bacterium]|nr:DUF1571 domain-containing protein [Planctomycetota bacterium]